MTERLTITIFHPGPNGGYPEHEVRVVLANDDGVVSEFLAAPDEVVIHDHRA